MELKSVWAIHKVEPQGEKETVRKIHKSFELFGYLVLSREQIHK